MKRGIQCRYALSVCQGGALTLEPASESKRAVTGWATSDSMKDRVGSFACDESQTAVRDVQGSWGALGVGAESRLGKPWMVMVGDTIWYGNDCKKTVIYTISLERVTLNLHRSHHCLFQTNCATQESCMTLILFALSR